MALGTAAAVTLLLLAAVAAGPAQAAKPLRGKPPYAIAHRGLSGVYPEHTARAYQQAIKAGADFIECDVVPTKDCKLLCRHEPELATTTDALEKFPALEQTYNIDGTNYTGVFSFNLTLKEVKTLRAKQQVAIRDQRYNGRFGLVTLEEYIEIAQAAPRVVGIYPETKHPSFHDSLNLACFKGKSFTEAVVDVLTKYGYTSAAGTSGWRRRPAFLQSFERNNLLAVAKKTKVPLVFLTDEFDLPVPYESDATYGGILGSNAELRKLYRQGIRGIGPWKNTLVSYTADNLYLNTSTIAAGKELVRRIQAAGFQVHIYTLRNEPKRPDDSGYLPFDFEADPDNEYELFFEEIGVDGGFSDHVGSLASYLRK